MILSILPAGSLLASSVPKGERSACNPFPAAYKPPPAPSEPATPGSERLAIMAGARPGFEQVPAGGMTRAVLRYGCLAAILMI
jgi:hypothetical protein